MINHLYCLARAYSYGMIGTGLITALVDHCLFSMGRITRRVSLRGCFVIGLLWPLFIILLVEMLWKLRKQL